MSIHLAAVTFSTVQALLLIALCFGSLIIALYCVIFMVPVKRFMARIHSLGGGMKGLEAHLSGLKSETDSRIAALEESLAGQTAGVEGELHGLRQELEQLQVAVREDAATAAALGRRVDALVKAMTGVESEFQTVSGELREKLRQEVADSYQGIESSVLSALEAVRDEMLRETRKLRAARDWGTHGRPSTQGRLGGALYRETGRRVPGKIISPGVLFAELDKGQANVDQPPEGEDAESGAPEGEPAPAS
ncbi:MAG: hypothetical protein QGI33_00935 [Candidatus Brocadiia bacterium]|nr:hypothetical protein [Candidatus Brocadiia bacterium]